MARIVIKESEIRNYVRSLIREARKQIDFAPDIQNGTFDLEKTEMMPGSRRWLNDFFKSKGIPKPRKAQGEGAPNRIIDYKTGELVNGDEINQFVSDRRSAAADDHRKKARERARGLSSNAVADNQITKDAMNNFNNDSISDGDNAEPVDSIKDEYGEKWLNMSDDEREALKKDIINARKAKQASDVDRYREMGRNSISSGFPNADEIRDRIAMLKDKQAALGNHNDINDKKWREYDFLIKDCQKILNKYYGGETPTDSNDEMADEIVKNALADDLSSAEEFADTDPNAITPNKTKQEKEPSEDYDPLDNALFGRSKKKQRGYDDLSDFYGDDDDDMDFMW